MWIWYIFGYLGFGLSLVVIGSLFDRSLKELKEIATDKTEQLHHRILLPLLCGCVAILIWPIFIFRWTRVKGGRKKSDEDYKKLYQKRLEDSEDVMNLKMEGEIRSQALKCGYGEYGLEITNPIPAKIEKGRAFSNSLKTSAGKNIKLQHVERWMTPVSELPVDEYLIFDLEGNELVTLYFSHFQGYTSKNAPKGFMFNHASGVSES
jgi:hypothetical protein